MQMPGTETGTDCVSLSSPFGLPCQMQPGQPSKQPKGPWQNLVKDFCVRRRSFGLGTVQMTAVELGAGQAVSSAEL